MFDVVCYNNTAENMRVDKTNYLTSVGTYTGELINPTNTLAPSIELDIDTDSIPSMNYCYISAFGRYYYINEIVTTINGLWEIHCMVDVLMSHKTLIKQQTAYIARNEFDYDDLLMDNQYPSFPAIQDYRINPIEMDTNVAYNKFQNGSTATASWIIVMDGLLERGTGSIASDFGSYYFASTLTTISDFLQDVSHEFALNDLGKYIHDIYYVPMLPANMTTLQSTDVFNFPGIDTVISGADTRIPMNQGTWQMLDNGHSKQSKRWYFEVSGRSPEYLCSSKYRTLTLVFPPFAPAEIDTNIFMRNSGETANVYIECQIDILTGSAALYYGRYANAINIPIGNAKMRIDIPLGTSSISIKNIMTSLGGGIVASGQGVHMAGTGVGNIGSVVSAYKDNINNPLVPHKATAEQRAQFFQGAGEVAGGAVAATLGAAVAVTGIVNAIESPVVGMHGSPSGGFIESPRLIETIHNIVDRNDSLYGRPFCQTRVLNTLHGYTQVGAIHLENMSGVFLQELEAIEGALIGGVIL